MVARLGFSINCITNRIICWDTQTLLGDTRLAASRRQKRRAEVDEGDTTIFPATNAAVHERLYLGFISHKDSNTYMEVHTHTRSTTQKNSPVDRAHHSPDRDYIFLIMVNACTHLETTSLLSLPHTVATTSNT